MRFVNEALSGNSLLVAHADYLSYINLDSLNNGKLAEILVKHIL